MSGALSALFLTSASTLTLSVHRNLFYYFNTIPGTEFKIYSLLMFQFDQQNSDLLVYRVRRLPRHDCRVRRRVHDRHRVRLRLRRLPQKLEERASSGILMFFMVRMNVLRQVGQAEISLERRAPLRVQIFVHIFFDEMLKSSTVMQCHLGW